MSDQWEAFRELETPCLLVDLSVLDKNIANMAALAEERGVNLRPHVKAHKCVEIARRQLEAGARGLTVAKLGEAEVMAEAGVADILIAYPIVGEAKLVRLMALLDRCRLTLALDSLAVAEPIAAACVARERTLDILLEVDTGLGRLGVLPGPRALALAGRLAAMPGLRLVGLMTHAGHVYACAPDEVASVGRREGETLAALAQALAGQGLDLPVISAGSTPTARHAAGVPGVTEIRPGNYVFHDAVQLALGVAVEADCALTVLTTVVGRPALDRAVVDAGSKTLALDRGAHGAGNVAGFGRVVGRPGFTVTRLSEEHGILSVPPGEEPLVGERLRLIPNHACTVANLADRYYVVQDGLIAAEWPVAARGLTQ